MTTLDTAAIRTRFPALVAHPEVVHTCAPGGTQMLDAALEAMRHTILDAAANQHAAFPASARVDAIVEDARGVMGRLLGSDPDGVVFGSNMTTLAFHLSHALDEVLATGGEIVCTRLDHDANVAPWLALAERTGAPVRWIDITADGRLDTSDLDGIITDRTRLVAFPLASNALGSIVDPAPLVAAARAVGALTVMDAVHGAPHLAVDRETMGVDVVFCSPYKFFGSHSGVMAADPALLQRLGPDQISHSPASGPGRWQTGTANFEAIAAAGAAATYLLHEVTLDTIQAHERQLTGAMLEGLASRDAWTLHGPAEAEGRTPTFALTHRSASPAAAADTLASHDVNAYAGHYYAIQPMRRLGLLGAGGALRVGFVHYHGSQDVDRVLGALDAVG